MTISIVLPFFNEERNVESVIEDVLRWLDSEGLDGEVIAVNDGSEDGTGGVLNKLSKVHKRLKVIHHDKNSGVGSALRSGFSSVTGEIAGFMDGDGQFCAAEFNHLLPHLRFFDFVTGERIKRADPFPRVVWMCLFSLLMRFVLGVKVRDINCGMKLFRYSIWDRICPVVATGGLFHAETFYRLKKEGIKWKTVPVNHLPRSYGRQTGASLRVIFKIIFELVRLMWSRS